MYSFLMMRFSSDSTITLVLSYVVYNYFSIHVFLNQFVTLFGVNIDSFVFTLSYFTFFRD